jgi:hypothetical protein
MSHPKSALFNAENVPVAVYVRLLNSVLGSDWVSWEPETLRTSISTKFSLPTSLKSDVSHQPIDRAMASIFAAKTLLGNPDVFATRIEGFENIILAFNNHVPNFEVLEVASPAEISYGIQMARMIHPNLPKFSEDVVAYIQACFVQHGVFAYPKAIIEYEPDSQKDLREKIRARVEDIPNATLNLEELVDVQAAKLYDVENYVFERLSMAKEEMAKAK